MYGHFAMQVTRLAALWCAAWIHSCYREHSGCRHPVGLVPRQDVDAGGGPNTAHASPSSMASCSQITVCTAQIKRVSPLAAVHTLGNLLTNVSLGRVAVSFTHTIKASICSQSGYVR